jgi:hypothetical protein
MNRPIPIRIFVLIDALGWPVVRQLNFLPDLLPYRRPLRTILGYSSGAIPSILTGQVPAEHGHWNLFYYDPIGSPFRWLRFLGFLPHGLLDNRIGRRLLKEVGRRLLGLGPLFEVCVPPHLLPWFNWIEKRNIYAPAGIGGGGSIFDDMVRSQVPHLVYSYHQCTDAEILRSAAEVLEQGRRGIFFLYLSELDGFLHGHCDPDAVLQERLDRYASGLRRVLERARSADPEATMAVFSDHGMTPVRQRHDLVAEVEALGLRMPDDYLAVYDSTMARFWPFSERARRSLREKLASVSCGRLLTDGELTRLGVFFPDHRYGEMVFLLDPGWLVGGSDFNGRGWTPAGMHGYHPDDAYSDAVYLSTHPVSEDLRTITDIHKAMRDAVQATAVSAGTAR